MRATETLQTSKWHTITLDWESSDTLPPLEIFKEDHRYGQDTYIFLTYQEAENLRDFLNKCLDKPNA